MSEPVEVKLGSETVTLDVPRALWVREAVRLALGECTSVQTRVLVSAAAVMLCAVTTKKPRFRYDVLAYGAECMEFLRQAGVPKADIYSAGAAAIEMIDASLPTETELEDARGNSQAPSGG